MCTGESTAPVVSPLVHQVFSRFLVVVVFLTKSYVGATWRTPESG